jgi:predicted HAD superfamily Cof-like phosphohydrolase
METRTFQSLINSVKEFHDSFGLNSADTHHELPDEKTIRLRHRLMQEENDEYLEAALSQNTELIADALGDKLYILCGTILAHGLQHKIEEVFFEIHRSNMSKLGRDGKPIYREDGKVMKGPDYFLPDIKGILEG